MLARKEIATAVKDAAEQAGSLVAATLLISLCALLLAGAALVVAVKARH